MRRLCAQCRYAQHHRALVLHPAQPALAPASTTSQRVVVAHPYAGSLADLVGKAKAGASSAAVAAATLSDLLPALPDDAPAGGCVVAIPPSRGQWLGPHLGSALARALARRCHRPLRPLLAATRLAAEQHLLTAAGRRANVEGLFRCTATPPA